MRSLAQRVEEIWQGDVTGAASRLLTAGLQLLSLPYGAAVALRNGGYDRGCLRQERLPCPVVSVGNLTVGGTGKTPMVILIARLLQEKGRRPAVLSRGYGGRAKSPVNVVADGKEIRLNWREAGDEPVLIALSVPGVPVLTGPRRSLTGRAAIGQFGADCLILDDAFQHRALGRDLDIVLIDGARPFGNGLLLPAGPLRESPRALARAGLTVVTGTRPANLPPDLSPPLPSFRGRHCPLGLVEGGTGLLLPIEALRGVRVCAFAGIGRPEAFRKSLAEVGAQVVAFRAFPDHHPFSREELGSLTNLAAESGAERIVTTEKDGIRLADFPKFLDQVLFLRVGMEVSPAGPFAALLFERLLY